MMPSYEAVTGALNDLNVDPPDKIAREDIALSWKRCNYLCQWLLSKPKIASLFQYPVPWRENKTLHDYPKWVKLEMDISLLLEYTNQSGSFSFPLFLNASRLIWSNACRYNPPHNTVHKIASCTFENFEEKIIRCQQDTQETDAFSISIVFRPVMRGLENMALFDSSYMQHLKKDAFDYIVKWLEEEIYVSKEDLKTDGAFLDVSSCFFFCCCSVVLLFCCSVVVLFYF